MAEEGMKGEFDKGLDEIEETFECITKADYASSDSSFDLCEVSESDSVEGNAPGYTKIKTESEGWSSDVDLCAGSTDSSEGVLCDDFGEFSVAGSTNSSEAVLCEEFGECSIVKSTNSSDPESSSADRLRRVLLKEKYKRYQELMMQRAAFNEDPWMSDSEFKEFQLREIVKELALPFLPAKSLARFRSVSKAWDHWIMNPFLAHRQSYHFRHMSGYFYQFYNSGLSFISLCPSAYGIPDIGFLPQNSSLISSCNGLLLYRTTQGDITYYVCNPSTKKCKQLPQPSSYHGQDPIVVLAFEPSDMNIEAHFQVVSAFQLLDEPALCFDIYSSKSNTWKSVDALCTELSYSVLKNDGIYFNGMAYWETMTNEVLAFDLESNIHCVLPLPSDISTWGTLGQIKGELCYVTACKSYGLFAVSFYKGMYSMNLTKTCYFDLGMVSDNSCRVLPCLGDDTVMLLVGACIYRCCLHDGSVEMVKRRQSSYPGGKYLPYVNSLVFVA